jgi:ribonuclease D
MQSDFSNQFQICDRDLTPATLSQYLASESLAVDTETMGLRPHRDRLCLVQLCDGQDNVTVLRIAQGQTEAPHLKQLLEAPHVTKIFHFARFDIATLRHYLGIVVQPLFCTKVASKLARTYSSRHGLKELIRELEGVDLDKTAQSSDWGNAAHLSEEQLRYAANDVRYLVSARTKLTQMLQREGRWELAQACLACLPTLAALDLADFEQIFEH